MKLQTKITCRYIVRIKLLCALYFLIIFDLTSLSDFSFHFAFDCYLFTITTAMMADLFTSDRYVATQVILTVSTKFSTSNVATETCAINNLCNPLSNKN